MMTVEQQDVQEMSEEQKDRERIRGEANHRMSQGITPVWSCSAEAGHA